MTALRRAAACAAAASFGGLASFAGVARGSAPAAAAAPGSADVEPIRVVVHAPEGCPSSGAFLEAVKLRTARVRAANPGEAARTFRVEVARQPDPSAQTDGASKPIFGQLTVQDADGGASESRTVRGTSCTEVEAALELVTALAIDAEAHLNALGRAADAADATDAGDASGAESDAGEDASDAAIARPPAPVVDAATNAEGLIVLETPLEVPSRPWSWAAGAGFDLVGSGESPISPGARIFAETRLPEDGVVTPSFRLSLSSFATSTTVDGASAAFRWFLAQGDICPVRLELFEDLNLLPCAAIEAGVLDASAPETTTGFARALRSWIAGGPLARLELAVADPLFFELGGGLRFPFVRESFTFDDTTRIYRAPPVIGSGGIDVGVRFR